MSDENDTTEDLTTESENDSELVRRLRNELKNTSSALQEERGSRIEIERREAFRQAGIDPTSGPGKLLFDNYDGDPTAEAVNAKIEEYGLTAGTPSTTDDDEQQEEEPTVDEQEKAAMKQMDQAATGGAPDRLPEDPAQAAHEAFDREMATSGSRKEAMAKSFNARMVTALEKQKRGK